MRVNLWSYFALAAFTYATPAHEEAQVVPMSNKIVKFAISTSDDVDSSLVDPYVVELEILPKDSLLYEMYDQYCLTDGGSVDCTEPIPI